MNEKMRVVLAVVLAGIVGTIVNAGAAALILGPDKLHFMMIPNRYLIAMAIAVLLPLLGLFTLGTGWRILSLVALVVVPTVIAKLVLQVGAPWALVLLLNSFYAFAALMTYEMVSLKRKTT